MGGPGVILSREAVVRTAPHIDSCLRNMATLHEDIELGRCITRFTHAECTKSYEVNVNRACTASFRMHFTHWLEAVDSMVLTSRRQTLVSWEFPQHNNTYVRFSTLGIVIVQLLLFGSCANAHVLIIRYLTILIQLYYEWVRIIAQQSWFLRPRLIIMQASAVTPSIVLFMYVLLYVCMYTCHTVSQMRCDWAVGHSFGQPCTQGMSTLGCSN